MLFISLILTITAVVLWKDIIHSKFVSIIIACLTFLSLFLSGFWYVSDYLTGSGIDESVIFHLRADMGGAALADFAPVIVASVIYLIISIIFSLYVYHVVRNEHASRKHKMQASLASFALFFSLAINPGITDLTSLVKQTYWVSHEDEQPIDYLIPDDATVNLNNKNLVFIYLESVERTYLDENIFPGLMPNLRRIETVSLSFTDIWQIVGSNWTIGGMVSSQCGIPLFIPSGPNSMVGINRFLPEATCMGDILSANGYELSYLGGARLAFGGKGNFYKTHGFTQVEGLDELIGNLSDTSYRSDWGLYDDTLFDMLKQRFNELSTAETPFGLFALTLDTHSPNGHVSTYCNDVKYKDGLNPILNAVHCSDKMVAEVYDYITKHESFGNTLLVIASDHLAMRNTAYDDLGKRKRRNLLLISGEGLAPKNIAKLGALIDVSPTVLNLLGADNQGLGFGRDLLGVEETLSERLNYNGVENFLRSNRRFISSLWDFPQINGGLTVDVAGKHVILDSDSIKYPTLIMLGNNLRVEEIRFYGQTLKNNTLSRQIVQRSPEQKFIWVDSCQKMAWLNNENAPTLKSDSCVAIGSLDSSNISTFELSESMSFSRRQISDIIKSQARESAIAAKRIRDMEFISKYGSRQPERLEFDPDLTGDFIIRSAGGIRQGMTIIENKVENNLVSANRGLTLYGVLESGPATPIKHLDTCGFELESLTSHSYSFQNDISRLRGVFGAFIIVAHDSAVCGRRDFTSLFLNTGLTQFNKIGHRTPYIAVLSGANQVREYIGDAEQALLIEASKFIQKKSSSGH